MAALTVGLTGGLASGKSTLGRWLAEAGFEVVDSDRVVSELYRPQAAGSAAVAQLFGPGVLDHLGGVDRARVAERVFADDDARRALEQAIHPLVRQHLQRMAAGGTGVMLFELPLLVEAGMADDFDLVVTVETNLETRVERAVERGLTEAEARARIAAQTSEALRRDVADIVIENDGSLDDLRRQADQLVLDLETRELEARETE